MIILLYVSACLSIQIQVDIFKDSRITKIEKDLEHENILIYWKFDKNM